MAGLRTPARSGQRRPAATWPVLALAAVVLAAHLLLADGLVQLSLAGGRGDKAPAAIEVALVRELQAAAPPPRLQAPTPPPARLPAVAARPASPASQAAEQPAEQPATATHDDAVPAAADPPAQSAPDNVLARHDAETPEAGPAPPTADPPASAALADSPPAPVPVPATAAAAASTAQAFDWPPSTRMNYRLTGHYRGPVNGTAQVEWLREGSRYQVRMHTAIGPVLSRQIVSEGELTDTGLQPRRFDGEQKVLFSAARRWSLRFGAERITLADGREIDKQPGAQDEASQFVQLSWLFTTQPELLRVGQSVVLPLIVSRSLDRWTYDVVDEEVLVFPFGSLPAFHLKPRRAAQGNDLAAEIWFAPSLQYLPVRILIRQGEQHWVDLMLERPPLQAALPAAPAPR